MIEAVHRDVNINGDQKTVEIQDFDSKSATDRIGFPLPIFRFPHVSGWFETSGGVEGVYLVTAKVF